MKPNDLKSPFSWEERQIIIEDRIWYIPPVYDRHDSFFFPGWGDPLVFCRENPVKIEYCSGNGLWIADRALKEPDVNWVAVERKFERVRRIWSKIKNHRLENLLAVCGEGHALTHHYLLPNSVDEVFINFPDPWPKTKHAKHRIVQPSFIQEIHRILKPGCLITLVTDDSIYSSIMINVMQACDGFTSVYPDPYYITEMAGYGTSSFDRIWREKGKTIHYHQFRKR
jgi:tRNA (guanine-N7-)-methyltransferase